MSKKQKSVSDQLNDLINPTPVNFDPEEDIHTETAAKVVENDYDEDWLEDSALSQYRKQNADLIEETDERYTGKKVSRKTVVQSDESEESDAVLEEQSSDVGSRDEELGSEKESEDEDDLSGDQEEDNSDDDDDDDEEGDSDEDDDEEDEDNEDYSIVQTESKDDSFQHLAGSKAGEVEKGIAIRNQLGLWDQLLEARIRLQKCLALANRMPQPDTLPAFKREGGTDFLAQANQTKQSVSNLLQKLLELRTERLKAFSETKAIRPSKKRSRPPAGSEDEEITSSEDEKDEEEQEAETPSPKRVRPDDIAALLARQHGEFTDYRNATIQKWNDKTRVAVGNVSSKNFSAFEQSTLRQIEQILSNRPRLVARTQLKRSSYKVLGKAPTVAVIKNQEDHNGKELDMQEDEQKPESLEDKTKEHDTEVFDDDDFYHQLLRELIERKAVDVTDPVQLGRQWLELQKIRSKMKRKVDMRATKGRKLRYTVHPKLVNFMAPMSFSDWTEEAKTDLFNSLFGKTLDSTGANNNQQVSSVVVK